ncbi:VWA domain-containing protein [Acidobacteria bacterium AB60]|nr:VWA domain-containing protein [Acidobacteria bacterium AB60]
MKYVIGRGSMRRSFVALAVVLLLASSAGAQSPSPSDPVLVRRPPPRASNPLQRDGDIHLDVTVHDAQDKPVPGLEPWDFHLTDNGKPAKILSFRGFDGVVARPNPPVEVILVIDEVNLPFQQVAFVRSELTQFLRQNGGRLPQPVTLMQLTDKGVRVRPRPTTDGNALVNVLDQISGRISYINPAMGGDGALERLQISVRGMADIAENEAARPGRKLLVWIGPGWPVLESARFLRPDDKNRRRYFDAIVELTNKLREARITVNSVSGLSGDPRNGMAYQRFLDGVPTPAEASGGYLALKVLVTRTGGRILGPGNDLAEQINACIADANAFYSISFNPPAEEPLDTYHELALQLDKAGLTAKTTAGYYFDSPQK